MSAAPMRSCWAAVLGLVLAFALAAAPAAAAADPAAPSATDSTTADALDSSGPVDLTEVTLGQRDVRMSLRIVSAGAWDSEQITSVAGREVCITLVHGEPASPRARICVARRSGRTALDLTPLAPDGTVSAPRPLAADISRPEPNVLEATFLPAAAGLSIGAFAWYANSAWSDVALCAATCRDRAPETGAIGAGVLLLAVPPCFGAAARDAARPCENPDLRDSVEPPPARAKVVPEPFCDAVQHVQLVTACSFGAPAEEAVRTFALIGDSHAANLKSALTVLTTAKRWRGVSILRPGCPATRGRPILPTRRASDACRRWNDQVLAWLARHPEVDRVFLSAHAGARVKAVGDRSAEESVRAGYREWIRAALRMGRRVVVIRDTPPSTNGQLRCVSRAMAAGRRAQTECTRSRSASLRADPLMAAARSVRSRNVKRIDLTRFFCDSRRCFSVVGGALVRHDESHLTQTFAATLGPFVLRALDG